MEIIILIKQIPDPEIPPASFKIDPTDNRVVPPAGVAPVIDPYSEHALEAALRLKDANPGSRVKAISLGAGLNRDLLKKTLALGADELILLDDTTMAESGDTARILALAITKAGPFDLILAGRQSADWDNGQTGALVAAELDLPVISRARKIESAAGRLRIEKLTENGYDVLDAPMPAVITVTAELGKLRLPNIKGVLAAKKKEPLYWTGADIGYEPAPVAGARLIRLYQPAREARCEPIPGETPEEQGANLALKLRELKLI
ncbi:Electron transfer flavoprotein alpha/beta-subunit [Dehalogenimonas lykanthroporepellens BL-DC-9]|nr:Electron transfer flavoprotein alpha/beta-subunit [Dehalogenimonas lykanthroporepellens BL-DC-9]